MVFSDPIFLFLFLPITLFVYICIDRFHRKSAIVFLCVASIFFYGFFRPDYVILISLSIIFNYLIYRLFLSKTGLLLGVFVNLALISYFKYAQFFVEDVFQIELAEFQYPILPLAISFFTFQQISFLVDQFKSKDRTVSFIDYFAYVTFFPQLIAGPIVRHNEFLPQVAQSKVNLTNGIRGFTLFSIGLIKKVLIADTASVWVAKGFVAANVQSISDAWVSALSYTVQIYYDFSGYSDMAIGMALMFGFVLPLNFNSPYKSRSIQDFWRTWHMTLSSWLKDYVYIPLGGNRRGELRRNINLAATMLIGGLWHGASWNFVVWGGLHGLALMIHRTWSNMGLRLPLVLAWLVTFIFVVNTWVIFRAEDFATATHIIKMMWSFGATGESTFSLWFLAAPVAILLVTLILPASQKIAEYAVERHMFSRVSFVLIVVLFFVALKQVVTIGAPSEFIYFQF